MVIILTITLAEDFPYLYTYTEGVIGLNVLSRGELQIFYRFHSSKLEKMAK